MRLSSRKWKWLGAGLAVAIIAFGVVRTWVVPMVIQSQLQAHYKGKVVFDDWWFGLKSSGITGLKLSESENDSSPVWFSADRISTDVSLDRLVRGKVMPNRLEVDHPVVAFRLDAKGQPLTRIPVVANSANAKADAKEDRTVLPDIVTRNGEITLDQQGRKPMTIRGVDARLSPVADGARIEVKTDDPTWGQVEVSGHFDPSFQRGDLDIKSSPGFVADPEKLERIPFIPAEVWANLEPRGPVSAVVNIKLDATSPKPVAVHTLITLNGTDARLNTLQVESKDTHGHVAIDDALVKVLDLNGKTLDGTIAAKGTLDFGHKIPEINLDLRLKDIDSTRTPKSWQIDELGATGRLSGRVDLHVDLTPDGPDLTGTAGRAVIENGTFQGIPIKSLSLAMEANGNDLQYKAMPAGSVDKNKLDAMASVPRATNNAADFDIADPPLTLIPLLDLASRSRGIIGWAAYAVSEVVELQLKNNSRKEGGLRLPKTISSQIELVDVDLVKIVEKARKFGIKIPVPITGKLSIKAAATIPLGALRDIKAYKFQGDATLTSASIDHVDLGKVSAHLDLADGLLDLSDLRGQFVEKPSGTDKNPPHATEIPPITGPLPVGAFRGRLKASIEPRGEATAKFEGNQLPIGELAAPFLPVPTPVSGDLTLAVEAHANLGTLADPKTYQLDGHVESHQIRYDNALLDKVAAEVHVKDGAVDLRDLSATLNKRPLKGSGHLDLAGTRRYSGTVTIDGWEIDRVLSFVPSVPKPSPVSGTISARAEATGTLEPFSIETRGGAKIVGTRIGAVPAGNVAFQWLTESDEIRLTGLRIDAFGGMVTGEARVPTKPGRQVEAIATLRQIDTAKLSSTFLGKGMSLSGVADGKLQVSMPLDASVINANATLEAPQLLVKPAANEAVQVSRLKFKAVARERRINYEATAESLGAQVRFQGSAPIETDLSKLVANAEFQAAGFRLGEVWRGLGMSGGLSKLDGLGAFNANIRAKIQPFELYSRGIFEFRDLHYGHLLTLGNLTGNATLTPMTWRIDQLKGDLFGGVANGEVHSESRIGGTRLMGFEFKVDRASLAKMTSAVPILAREFDGYGTFRISGRMTEALQASSEVLVSNAKAFGIPISDLRFPAEIELNPESGIGSVHSKHWTARMAGGSIRGSGWLRLGSDHSFQTDLQLSNLDIEAISRIQNHGKRPPTGRVSGKVTLSGPNPDLIAKLRGRVDLDLDAASLVEVPVFKELDRFLGSAKGGGLFEDGDLHGTIFNRTLFVEQLTLQGKLIQLHATGSVGFDGALNLEVLVNTNQTISPSGLAVVNLVPGLGQAIGRGEEVVLRLASFLENRLLKFRVTGTMASPNVQLDPGVAVGDAAVGFFSSVFRLPGKER